MWQHVKLFEQIRPWDTLACCWDVKQPTNKQTLWALMEVTQIWTNLLYGPTFPNQDALHQLPRHQQTTTFRPRTGHCRLNSHLKRTGVKTSAPCPCREADQTPERYLQSCSLHHQARQQIWHTCASLKTKLWGSVEDLFLTFKYAALTGERI